MSPLSMYPGVLRMWSPYQQHQHSLRNLLALQIHRPHPRPSESETLAGKPGLLRQQTIQVSGDVASPVPPPPTLEPGGGCALLDRVLGGPVSPSCPLLSAFGLWEGLQLGARGTTQLAGFEPVLSSKVSSLGLVCLCLF